MPSTDSRRSRPPVQIDNASLPRIGSCLRPLIPLWRLSTGFACLRSFAMPGCSVFTANYDDDLARRLGRCMSQLADVSRTGAAAPADDRCSCRQPVAGKVRIGVWVEIVAQRNEP